MPKVFVILFEANDVCHNGNTLLDTEEINMLVVLRMNREFIQHMRKIYPKLSGQNFNGTLVTVQVARLGTKLFFRNLSHFKLWKIILQESIVLLI